MRVEINEYIVADSEIYRKSKIFGRSRNALHFEICHGKPTFKGTRVMVWQVLEMLEGGMTFDDIIEDFPSLTKDHIKAALQYAADLTRGRDIATVNVPLGA